MGYRDDVSTSTDLEFLRSEVLKFQELNNRLHRRIQANESIQAVEKVLLKEVTESSERRLKMWSDASDLATKFQTKILNLPFFIKWIYFKDIK